MFPRLLFAQCLLDFLSNVLREFLESASDCSVPFEESLSLQVHRRELIEVVEEAREPMGFPSVMAMVQAMVKIARYLVL